MTTTTTTARIYVGTYAKYNSGSIAGAWLDLDDYNNETDFYCACRDLHADEKDPEFMYQDWEGIPAGMISESHLSDNAWDWLQLDDDDKALLAVYQDCVHADGTLEDAQEAFDGRHNDRADWAEYFLNETGIIKNIPENLRSYFDFDAYARDCQYSGDMTFIECNGDTWAFRSV